MAADQPDPDPATGDALRRAVEIMDRLRSPGGCPWDAAQSHESLARYLVEECYEVLEAIETGDRILLREELGDLLLQVLFHARIAQEARPGDAFGIDDVAGDLVDKLTRRHPHVFAATGQRDFEQLDESWEQQKVVEKGRTSAVDGVPIDQPALALAAKLVARARRAGLSVQLGPTAAADRSTAADASAGPDALAAPDAPSTAGDAAADLIGKRLLALVQEAVSAGVDPETALRRTARAYRVGMLAAEQART